MAIPVSTRKVDAGRTRGKLIIDNCIQMRIAWALPNKPLVFNVFHARVASSFQVSAAIATALATGLVTGPTWQAYAALINTTTQLTGVDLRDLRQPDQPVTGSSITAAPGAGTGGQIDIGSALVVTQRTSLGGRANRGRIYLPGFDRSAQIANGQLDPAHRAAVLAWVASIQGVMTSQGMTMGIGQPARIAYLGVTGTAHIARVNNVQQVLSFEIRTNQFGSQRRRAQP